MRLEERVEQGDARRFVGRRDELAVLEGLLDAGSDAVLAWVVGPPGSGKSALLRELSRRSRDLAGTSLTVVDDVDAARATALLTDVLPTLPARARVVVAGTAPPPASWWDTAWAGALQVLPVRPLDLLDAGDLLAAHGVREASAVEVITDWAQGHPLSLVRAAAAQRSRSTGLTRQDLLDVGAEVLDLVTGGVLAGPHLLARERRVLAVAALAPAVDADLLGAVLDEPGACGEEAERWLRSLPFAERSGTRIALPSRIRSLLADQVRAADPDLERQLRIDVIDHLTCAARDGRPRLMLDIREVLDPPQDRGMTPTRVRESAWLVDVPGAEDVADLRCLLAGQPDRAALLGAWLDAAPDQVVVVRRRGGAVVAVGIGTTPATMPPAAAEGPLATWRRWVLERDPDGPALMTPLLQVFPASVAREAPAVGALLLTALAQRSAVPDFRWWLTPQEAQVPDPAHCGGRHETALDLLLDGAAVPGFVLDFGPAGVIAAMQEQAHRKWRAPRTGLTPDDVRAALREVQLGGPGAGSGLAGELAGAVEAAFGSGRDGALLRDVVVLGYLAPDASHSRAMRALHISRSTYFRRLREAIAILAAWLGTQPAPVDQTTNQA